ncbi:GcrA cell cycle regulator [Sinorhizobium fredii]|uniref:GcrA cell cycle regulator n=1 Tax=Rhizobium fredii TaxID=380 RepID=A0A2A6LXN8_RHIFR|nr:GcrA family cell cycle regulator [Sinorhizobium fredii]PDT47314.1 GcrA cell cycle regulator [Sinorhizobium fredii]
MNIQASPSRFRSHHLVDIEEASKMWMADKSAGEIGRSYGVSRNVIIGIAYRNRAMFPQKSEVTTRNPQSKSRPKRTKAANFEKPLGEAAVEIEPTAYDEARRALAKSLMDIEAAECRFPIDNGRPFMFCASSVREGSAYCTHHHFRAYRKKEAASQ